eukprot:SAG11_NODE_4155_length_2037_cov_0.977296_3_plen_69_part_00
MLVTEAHPPRCEHLRQQELRLKAFAILTPRLARGVQRLKCRGVLTAEQCYEIACRSRVSHLASSILWY